MAWLRQPASRSSLLLVVMGFVLVAIVAAVRLVDMRARDAAVSETRAGASDDAAILAAGLQAELDKFSLVPLVLADDSGVRDVLAAGRKRAPELDRRFEALARQTQAAAIYLMNADGLTLAASNWRLPTSFVGSNYSFRRYFRDALASGAATQFALGTVSRKPGLYIAQRVEAGGRTLGIVAVKVEFDVLEASWRKANVGVFVTDPDGVVLITSRDDWRFRTTAPGSSAARDRVIDERQFGMAELKPLLLDQPGGRGPIAATLLDADQPIAFGGWRLHLLLDPASEIADGVTRARLYLALGVVALAALAALAIVLRRRREAMAQRLLERRTQELREQLGQANRLAILGQVTAGIGHEISQPVAAVQVFAENGLKLLDLEQADEARANFHRIVELAGKIGRITTELRSFARRGTAEPEMFPVGRAIDGAMMLLHDRIQRGDAVLTLPARAELETMVRAEPVRLEQVLVNLLQNALDAIAPGGTIAISLATDARHCTLRITDDGPGLGGREDRLFQPFATTKPEGLGLGLVISREIMRGIGGELAVEPCARGARFAMTVPRA